MNHSCMEQISFKNSEIYRGNISKVRTKCEIKCSSISLNFYFFNSPRNIQQNHVAWKPRYNKMNLHLWGIPVENTNEEIILPKERLYYFCS